MVLDWKPFAVCWTTNLSSRRTASLCTKLSITGGAFKPTHLRSSSSAHTSRAHVTSLCIVLSSGRSLYHRRRVDVISVGNVPIPACYGVSTAGPNKVIRLKLLSVIEGIGCCQCQITHRLSGCMLVDEGVMCITRPAASYIR